MKFHEILSWTSSWSTERKEKENKNKNKNNNKKNKNNNKKRSKNNKSPKLCGICKIVFAVFTLHRDACNKICKTLSVVRFM